MEINSTFKVKAICNHYKSGEEEPVETNININLNVNLELAAKFIFRFSPSVFEISDNFKVLFKYDEINNLIGIAFIKDDDIFIVKNSNKILSEITEGYIRLRTASKLMNIMEFDFESAKEEINYDSIPEEKFN